MDELWKVREKPTPIQLEALQKKKNGSGIASNDGKKDKSSSSSPSKQQQKSPSRSVTIASSSTAPTATTTNTDSSSRLLKGLERDQTVWDLEYTWTVFKSSLDSLAARLIEMRSSDPDATLFFDKDDSEALDFVTAR